MRKLVGLCCIVAVIVALWGGATTAAAKELIGAGATFPYPLYSKMFDVYSKEYGVKVNYQAIGSGGGIRQLINKTVDFAGSDAVMGAEDMKAASGPVLHIPICAGAVVITYNLPGSPKLNFSGDVIAEIFMGKITKWKDAKIIALNENVAIPDLPITVVHRSDGSGTTNVFSDYLSKVNSDWSAKVGKGTALNWPVGLGAKGNPGVAGLVRQTPGSIGYVELIYALQNKMSYGNVKNKKGSFIEPTLAATSAAADTALPDDMRVSLTDSDSPKAYPIAGFTWILVYKEQAYEKRTTDKANDLVKLLWWMTHQGQKYAEPMEYAPLSPKAAQKAENLIKSITYQGKPVMR
ncbi:MAG TPA: phosphate ABC transporter substrate-binding protein PstS [Deltaproteobacteria bacterium]|nr:phosphate ABC transporter substrate-binding protein PstS [Deltaproteobacteria bacterium]